MGRQQPAERKRRTTKAPSRRDRGEVSARRQAHPVLTLQRTVGNACIARMLSPSGSNTVQRAAYVRYSGLDGETLDEEHTRWITLALADSTARNGATKSEDGGSSRANTADKDMHTWAHALGLAEWEL